MNTNSSHQNSDVPDNTQGSTALVPLDLPQRPAPCLARSRHSAAFLTQLAAHAARLPHTRARRRTAPGHAAECYGKTLILPERVDTARPAVLTRQL